MELKLPGLNECDLKRDFHKVFGLPVRQYVIKCRMERARNFARLYERFFEMPPLTDR